MKKAWVPLIVFFFNFSQGWSAVPFHCYTIPGLDVQVYEFGSSNCGSMDSAVVGKTLGQIKDAQPNTDATEVTKDVLCVYQAFCKAVPDSEGEKEPPKRSDADLNKAAFVTRELKLSVLLCAGKGSYNGNHILQSSECLTASKCANKDIFYNMSPGQKEPPPVRGVLVPKFKAGTREN